jgi:hypothetical protein
MSKKLIAVASAAALALSALVGVAPANAATSLSGGGEGTGASVAQTKLLTVPADNSVEAGQLLTLTVATAEAKTVSATADNGIKLVKSTQNTGVTPTRDWAASEGSATFSTVAASAEVVFYAFATTTAQGTIVVNDGIGNTQTFFLKGTSAKTNAYKISMTGPASSAINGDIEIKGTVKDSLGNDVAEMAAGDFTVSVVGGTATYDTSRSDEFAYDADTKTYTFLITGRAESGQVAVSISLKTPAAEVKALGARTLSSFIVTNSQDLSERVKALEAQIKEMRLKANSVTKKKYNTLARKWNAAFPSQRVALKK